MDCALEDSYERDILYGELKKSEALKIALQPYKLKPQAERTYAELMRLFKDVVAREQGRPESPERNGKEPEHGRG